MPWFKKKYSNKHKHDIQPSIIYHHIKNITHKIWLNTRSTVHCLLTILTCKCSTSFCPIIHIPSKIFGMTTSPTFCDNSSMWEFKRVFRRSPSPDSALPRINAWGGRSVEHQFLNRTKRRPGVDMFFFLSLSLSLSVSVSSALNPIVPMWGRREKMVKKSNYLDNYIGSDTRMIREIQP